METYLTRREALIRDATPGLSAARELSDLTDAAVRELSRAAASRVDVGRWALIALGGWGASALLPSSDLDILILSDAPSRELKPFVESVLYPLWDSGVAVGHQVRSPKEQRRAMREDLTTCTAGLTGRTVAGDVAWADGVLAAAAIDAHKRSQRLLSQLAIRPRPGTPYALEPDLKEDAGGRRDYDELVWSAAISSGIPQNSPHALITAGFATAEEIEQADDAAAVVAAARFAISRAGLGSRMTLDAAQFLAETPVTPAPTPAQVQHALAATALVLSRVRRRIAGNVVEPDSPLNPDAVFAALDAEEPMLGALEEAAQAGRLDELLPGYRDLMTLRRPGIGHNLTVGAHSLKAAFLVGSMTADGALGRSALSAEHRRALQVAALIHDVGKTHPGPDHALRGVEPARYAASRFGLSPADAQTAADLVRLHLMLPETATTADLDDEDEVLEAAALIGTRELLAPLHLLTAADSMATGPNTWSRWTAALVGTLVARLDAALSDDVDGAGIAARGDAMREEVLATMPDEPSAQREFVAHAPLRYLASRDPAEISLHARLVAKLSASPAEGARVAIGAGPAPETHAVTVVAPDRPQLLARIAGAMSLAGLDILALDAYGSSGGVALDTFVVTSATMRPIDTETFTKLERLLLAALHDRLELKTRLAERRRHYPARVQGKIVVETVSAGWDTAVRVTAPDRPGLLHDLASAVYSAGLDIRWAKVLTVDGMALDTFHVVGPDGGPVDDPGVLGHLAMRFREIQ